MDGDGSELTAPATVVNKEGDERTVKWRWRRLWGEGDGGECCLSMTVRTL